MHGVMLPSSLQTLTLATVSTRFCMASDQSLQGVTLPSSLQTYHDIATEKSSSLKL
jgi:hypothetical protein